MFPKIADPGTYVCATRSYSLMGRLDGSDALLVVVVESMGGSEADEFGFSLLCDSLSVQLVPKKRSW